jgi:hypothetical protein
MAPSAINRRSLIETLSKLQDRQAHRLSCTVGVELTRSGTLGRRPYLVGVPFTNMRISILV